MKSITQALLHGMANFACAACALAGTAIFSPDGKSVMLLPPESGGYEVWRIDLETKAVTKIPLGLPENHGARSLACGAEGELLMLTDKAVYVHDAKGTKKVCDTKGVEDAGNLATAPPKAMGGVGDWLFVTGKDKNATGSQTGRVCYARKPGGKSFEEVFGRRIDKIGEGAFTRDGRYFFLADDMLWEGSFSYDPDTELPAIPSHFLI